MNQESTNINFKEYIDLALAPIHQELTHVRSTVDRIAVRSISRQEFDALKYQVASLAEMCSEVDDRLERLEHHDQVLSWSFRFVAGVLAAVIITWLVRFL